MTIIAWDGRTLAADKRATYAGLGRTVTKIMRAGEKLYGFSGDGSRAMEMLAWHQAGADPTALPATQRNSDDFVSMVVIEPGPRILSYELTPYPVVIEDAIYALGAGRDYAMAAMFLGFDAQRAVEVACHFDTGCGNGIDTLTLD